MSMKFPSIAILTALSFPLLAQAPQVVAGKDLPWVIGPMAGNPARPATGTALNADPTEVRLRAQARSGAAPCVAVPPGNVTLDHGVSGPAAWMAYRVEVGPLETVHARLTGLHPAWFHMRVMDKSGQIGNGMLQNQIPTGNPEASFINSSQTAKTVYFLVDANTYVVGLEPYQLAFTRVKGEPAKL